MKNPFTLFLGVAAIVSFALPLAGVVAAQITFDPATYKALADADATIPAGTKITMANWQEYKQFMPLWMQVAFQGQYHWHVEAGNPEYTVEVTPSIHYPLPVKFVQNTAKYGGQTELEEMPSGGYKWRGYVAGMPFPNPAEPNLGVKILYNRWADFRPMISHFWAINYFVDGYGNVTNTRSSDAFYRLSHLSEPGQPMDLPFARGLFFSSRLMVELPEEFKYTTELALQPDDPTRIEEVYAFLPALRRSLRLSSGARCVPVLGSDFVQDDISWLPANFEITLLGKKKLLMAVADPAKAFDLNSYVRPPDRFPGWMKPTTGKWELRNVYVLD